MAQPSALYWAEPVIRIDFAAVVFSARMQGGGPANTFSATALAATLKALTCRTLEKEGSTSLSTVTVALRLVMSKVALVTSPLLPDRAARPALSRCAMVGTCTIRAARAALSADT